MENSLEKTILVTADGIPLKTSLARAQRRSKFVAFSMVLPLLTFVMIAFLIPIADMLSLSVDNSITKEILPKSVIALQNWDETSGELPDEVVFAAIVEEIKKAKIARKHTRVGQRLNYESSGFSSLFRKAGRKVKKINKPTLLNFSFYSLCAIFMFMVIINAIVYTYDFHNTQTYTW